MSLLSSELEQVVAELAAALRGAVVQKVFLPRPALCFLEVRQVGRTVLICLSAELEGGRLSVAESRPPSPARALAMQQRLRKLLIGTQLERLASTPQGRSVQLDFASPSENWRLQGIISGSGGERLTVMPLSKLADDLPADDLPEEQMPQRAEPRFTPLTEAPFPWAQAAETFGRASEETGHQDALRRQREGQLKAQLKRLRRTLEKVRVEANRGPLAEQHRRFGELIAQNVARIPRGARSVELMEYGEAGAWKVEVPLHPERAPREEAKWNFRQYRRLQRGVGFASERLRLLEGEAEELEASLRAVADGSWSEGLVARTPIAPKPKRAPVAKPYKRYRGAHEGQIWVGKGGADNDQLTFQLARPNDVWLHVRGVPGAHVVISWGKAAAPPQELLLDAAHLAVYHSSAKGEPRVEVSHTRVRNVRRVKGGPPGSVSYSGEKTFLLRLEPVRLKRLLLETCDPDR